MRNLFFKARKSKFKKGDSVAVSVKYHKCVNLPGKVRNAYYGISGTVENIYRDGKDKTYTYDISTGSSHLLGVPEKELKLT